jgi:hypothetical protein
MNYCLPPDFYGKEKAGVMNKRSDRILPEL